MKKKIVLISFVAITTLTSCEAIKNCFDKDSKTENHGDGACGKCGKTSCSASCGAKASSDTLKLK